MTEGPWMMDHLGNVRQVTPIDLKDNPDGVVAEVYEREDAVLIAAAPDLLEALRTQTHNGPCDHPVCDMARKAIVKATGMADVTKGDE